MVPASLLLRSVNKMEIIYIALYDLKSPHKRVLNFREGEKFLPVVAKQTDPNWSLGIDLQGNIGYIPCSYVRSEKVKKQELTHMIDDILEILHLKCDGTYTNEQRQIIQQLSNKRSALMGTELASKLEHSSCESEKSSQINEHNAHPVLSAITCNNETVLDSLSTESAELSQKMTEEGHSKLESDICVEKLSENLKKEIQELEDHSEYVSQITSSETVAFGEDKAVETENLGEIQKFIKPDIPVWLVSSLIENVRSQTHLSHQNSKLAIAVVLDTLKDAIPDLSCVFTELRETLNKCEAIWEQADNVIPSEDRRKLQHIFKQLWYCKNDEQQRSWPVHEDEVVIKALLEELYVILIDADPRVSREVIQVDDYEMVHLLVTYYQMEPRRSLRMNMLHVFAALCELDITVISHFLTSILPMEIARDMQCSSDDDLKLQYSAYLLNIIFSTGQKPPNGLYEFFNERFMQFLLEMLEKFVEADQDDIANHFLSVILSFNLHFQDTSENIILQMLKKKNDARILSEKLVLLLNREEDPTRILSHKLETPNSVLKFLVDFFSHPDTTQLFYLNDIKVVLDIIVRQLTDYFPGEQKRMWYLRLVANILRNSNYEEHHHQKKGLQKCFNTVLTQEDPCVQEMALVNEILKEFSIWFSMPSI